MHELFASCAARYPGATALIHHGSRLTYSELDALSDHYAVALESAGVGPGDFVPVVIKRSPELVALLLAILKRGAAYSAMDPRWPAERLAALIARLHARLVVTETPGPWLVPAFAPPLFDPAGPARRPSPVQVGPDDPSSILFTSGSTGEPKGVVSAHRGTVRLFDVCDWMPAGPGVTMPQVSAASWDGFAIDCWGPLLTGGTTVLVDEPALTPAEFRELREKHGVNVVWLTPSLFNMLVDEDVQSFAGIHAALIGGERASSAHSQRFLECHPGTRLINIYGPSECGVLVTTHGISVPDCAAADGIPLGRAAPYTGIHVLDGTRVCEDGQVGEICLAGAGLAIGYLDDAEANARKFVDVEIDGIRRRIYRTGDLGHWSGDRKLCFDGRSDLQVQVHGYRIEPEEIERTAARVAGVTMSAVVPLPRNGEIDGLALFFTSRLAQVSEAGLRAELNALLPAYLVPQRIRKLDRLPLLSNGKVDRQLLEMIISETTVPVAEPAALSDADPQGATEIAVAKAVAEILGTRTVPRTASFLDLGADSLSMARVCARLEQATGAKVQVSQVYRTPNVAELAAWLDASSIDSPPDSEQAATSGLVRLTPMQAKVVHREIVSDLAWWLDGGVDENALERAASDVHRRHQVLHARYVAVGPQTGHATIPADPGSAQFRYLPPAQTDTGATDAIRAVLTQPLRIDDGKVWRCALVRSDESARSLFGVVVHHAAFDGWSARILAAELSTAYAARVAGTEPEFGAPVASLAQFDLAYRQQLAAIDLEAQRRYWLGEFRGLDPCRLPCRNPEPAGPAGPVTAPAFEVAAAQLRPWETYGRGKGMTAFIWVAAAYAEALIRAGAQRDLGLVFPTANRGNDLIDRSITCRVGVACLRPNGPSRQGRHLLARTHDAYNRAMAATDLLLDPAEIAHAVGNPPPGTPLLQGIPILTYQDALPTIKLGEVSGTITPVFGRWDRSSVDLYTEVRPGPAGGLSLNVVLRTDLYPAHLADHIGRLFLEIITEGPDQLEQRTAT